MFQSYIRYQRKLADLRSAINVLHWDMETYIPKKSFENRGRQITTLEGILFSELMKPEYEALLKTCLSSDLNDFEKTNISISLDDLNRKKKLNSNFIEKYSKAQSKGFALWQKAYESNEFGDYEKQLEQIIELNCEKANLIGYEDHIYDAFIEEYEPGFKTNDLDKLFGDLKSKLPQLLAKIQKSKFSKEPRSIRGNFDNKKIFSFSNQILKEFGFDLEKGRLDESIHPFSIDFGSDDVRLTTNSKSDDLMNCIGSVIHECGHGLYDQNVNSKYYGLPQGQTNSTAIHESQSRFYENEIGLSFSYLNTKFSSYQESFPDIFGKLSFDEFYCAVNHISPTFIRTQADEVTYHFHIMIRYEVEKLLLTKQLKVSELSECWNSLYEKYLGIRPPNLKFGALQDVHWSTGDFGYFPTYSIGSFYSSQLAAKMEEDIPEYNKKIQSLEFNDVRHWLQSNIYDYGRTIKGPDLIKQATGKSLDLRYYFERMERKYLK